MPFLTFQDLFLLRVFLDLKQFIRHKLWCPPKCVPFALFNHFSLSYSPCLVIGRTNLSNKTLISHDFQGPTVKFDDSPGLENERLKFPDFPRFPWPVRTLLVDFAKTTPCQMRTRKCAERTLDSQFAALHWPTWLSVLRVRRRYWRHVCDKFDYSVAWISERRFTLAVAVTYKPCLCFASYTDCLKTILAVAIAFVTFEICKLLTSCGMVMAGSWQEK